MGKVIKQVNITNKKALFEYFISQKFVAGISLTGTEVKSIKCGNAGISEAYCVFEKDELYVKSMNVAHWKNGTYNNHEPLRARKLLLKKPELRKIKTKSAEKGITIIPLKLFVGERGYIKLEIGIAQGKKSYDKRESLKERDVERSLRREEQ